jgi:hypothetical protein
MINSFTVLRFSPQPSFVLQQIPPFASTASTRQPVESKTCAAGPQSFYRDQCQGKTSVVPQTSALEIWDPCTAYCSGISRIRSDSRATYRTAWIIS